jgi:hypothetical protein
MSSPGDVNAPNAYPSGNGLRFLPGVLMLSYLIYLQGKREWLGHTLWFFGFIWSPEAGIHTSCLWVPYYLFNKHNSNNNAKLKLQLINSGVKLLKIFITYLATSIFLYFLIYSKIPELWVYFTYFINPVGMFPLKPFGIFLVLMTISIIWLMWSLENLWDESKNNINIVKESWAVALLCYANFSYCLGRSANGNMGVMLPYFGILLFVVYRYGNNSVIKAVATALLASIISSSLLPGDMHNYKNALLSVANEIQGNYKEENKQKYNSGFKTPFDIKKYFDRSSGYTEYYYNYDFQWMK